MNDYIIYPKQLGRQPIPVERNHCFFLMPFSKEFDMIYGTIKQYLNNENFICNRADEISGSTPIVAKILTNIIKSQYIIVDITKSNPNVFYELGIAHTLKEARNVLIIKQKNYDTPFDIKHLTYVEYDPQNLKFIASQICNFLNESKTKNEFYEALQQHGIINYIDDTNNELIELILSHLDEISIECLTQILLVDGKKYDIDSITTSFLSLKKYIEQMLIEKNYTNTSRLLDIFYEELKSVEECDFVRKQVSNILYDFFEHFNIDDTIMREYKTRLALLLAKNEMYIDIVLPWILNYFSRSKTATIDLNRYSVESFLMTSTSNQVDNSIISKLCDSDCYVREHMSDIIGEKKIIAAAPLLFKQLAKEKNFFTAQSMMEAIGKLKQSGGINVITQWVEDNKSEILQTKQLFVLKHALNAIRLLDTTANQIFVNKFENEFGAILKDYYLI